jgi:hypothetical protein
MRRFIIKSIVVLSLPILLLVYAFLIGVNENLHVADYDKKEVFLIGEPYQDNYSRYFKSTVNLDSIKVLAIGTSRVLQFKKEFFKESFFNLGYLVRTPSQTLKLIKHYDLRNKILIISIDQWTFNPNWQYVNDTTWTVPVRPSFLSTMKIPSRLIALMTSKITPSFKKPEGLFLFGSGAHLAAEGTLNDGSFYYGKVYHGKITNKPELVGLDFSFNDTKKRIRNGLAPFEWSSNLQDKTFQDIEELVRENITRGNQVLYFFPPFAPSIQQQLKSPNYRYMAEAAERIRDISQKYGVGFFDFTNFASTDSMFIDGFHGGAKLYYHLLVNMNIDVNHVVFKNNFETTNDSIYAAHRLNTFRD